MKKITQSARINAPISSFLNIGLVFFATFLIFGFSSAAKAQVMTTNAYTPFTSPMSLGSSGAQVTRLQQLLASNSIIYPSGSVTGYFGPLTQQAVGQFQLAYDIPAIGVAGPMTIAKLNGVLASPSGLDISAPAIVNINVSPSSTSVACNWNTSENAQGKIFYSTTPIQESEALTAFTAPYVSGTMNQTSNYSTTQNLQIYGLSSNTNYYYVVMATDMAGNVSVSVPLMFHTN